MKKTITIDIPDAISQIKKFFKTYKNNHRKPNHHFMIFLKDCNIGFTLQNNRMIADVFVNITSNVYHYQKIWYPENITLNNFLSTLIENNPEKLKKLIEDGYKKI